MAISAVKLRELLSPGITEAFNRDYRDRLRANLFFRMRGKVGYANLSDPPYSFSMWRLLEAAIEEGCDPEVAISLMEGHSHVIE